MEPFVLPETLTVGAVLLIAGVIVLGSVVQVGLGLGFGLTVAPLLALIDPALVPAPTLYLGMLTAGWAAFAERHAIVWREVNIATAGRVAGVIARALPFWPACAARRGFNWCSAAWCYSPCCCRPAAGSWPSPPRRWHRWAPFRD